MPIKCSTKTKVIVYIKLNETSKITLWLHRDERGYDDGELIDYLLLNSQFELNGKCYNTKKDYSDIMYDEDSGLRWFVMRWDHYTKDGDNFKIAIDARTIATHTTIDCCIDGKEYDANDMDSDKTIAHIQAVLDSQEDL